MKKLFLLGILVLSALGAIAQPKRFEFSEEPDQFISDILALVRYSDRGEVLTTAEQFQSFWSGWAMGTAQKKHFIELVKQMKEKGYKVDPDVVYLMRMSYMGANAQGMPPAEVDSMFYTVSKAVEKYDRDYVVTFMKNTGDFLKERALYQRGTDQIFVREGSMRFRFLDLDAAAAQTETSSLIDEPLDDYGDDPNEGEQTGDEWDDWDDNSYEDDWANTDNDNTNEEDPFAEEETVEENPYGNPLYVPQEIPVPEGPVIELVDVDYVLMTRHDTTEWTKTSATYMPMKKMLVGNGGKFDFSTAGMLEQDCYVEFAEYAFDLNNYHIRGEHTKLTNNTWLEEPVEGVFEYKPELAENPMHSTYPRFTSYSNRVKLKDLPEGLTYKGGFSMRGRRIFSASVAGGDCILAAESNDKPRFRAVSKYLEIMDSAFATKLSRISFYQGTDSIYHPGVEMRYSVSRKNIRVDCSTTPFKDAPYIDTYHEMELHVDEALWKIEDTTLYLRRGQGRNVSTEGPKGDQSIESHGMKKYMSQSDKEPTGVPAYFDSDKNFQVGKYNQLKGIYRFHPLQMAVTYSRIVRKREFYVSDLARHYKQKESTMRNAMSGLMKQGYIDYEPVSGVVFITPKAEHYVLSRKNKVDFDNITIESANPGEYNAEINMEKNELSINGVKKITLSDSLNVYIEPEDGKLTLLENRDLLFDGKVNANNYLFNGREFLFSYDRFDIELKHIDSLEFTVDVKDSLTGRVIGKEKLPNQLTYSSGKLYIDEPGNKSGRKRNPRYPYFDADKGAYVFFNRPEILGGVYDSTVYYKIPKFTADSLSNSSTEVTGFEGTFYSGDIFPSIKEKLSIMPDKSFGFKHPTPEEGYQLYGGQGKFKGEVTLSNRGIRGKGTIEFLNTVLESDDFIFYNDSVVTDGKVAFTKPGTNPGLPQSITFPQVQMDNYHMKWVPLSDSMLVSNVGEPFKVFDNTVEFDGTMNITYKGMRGEGKLQSQGAVTISDKFSFEERSFEAHDAQFQITSADPNKPALRSDQVQVTFDVDKGIATFSPEKKGVASNEFPYLQYKTSIDHGTWYVNDHKVVMKGDVNQSYFYSTNPDQDSLAFNASEAIYRMDDQDLHVKGVPHINVADGRVLPHNKEVFIKENAQIQTLHKAEIVLDTLNEYHHLFDGNINIVSRNKFEGSALYEYVNFDGDTLSIQFNSFNLIEEETEKKKRKDAPILHTVSKGSILGADTFRLAPKMIYRGEATMWAHKERLVLGGAAKIEPEGHVAHSSWLSYITKGDTNVILIDLEDQTIPEEERLSGIHYSYGGRTMYGSLASKASSPKDKNIFNASGVLRYNIENDRFDVGSAERMRNETYEGNLLSYDDRNEIFHLNGKFNLANFGPNEEKHISADFAGNGTFNAYDTLMEVNGMIHLNFELPDQAYQAMGSNLKETALFVGGPKAFNVSDTLYSNLANLGTTKAVDTYKKSLLASHYSPLYNAGKDFQEGIVLSDVTLRWSEKYQAWHSVGQLGLSHVTNQDVNTKLDGYLEIKNGRHGSQVTLYFELNPNSWYFFSFKNNQMLTVSSNGTYNTEITNRSTALKNQPKGLYFFDIARSSHPKRFQRTYPDMYLEGQPLEGLADAYNKGGGSDISTETPTEEQAPEEGGLDNLEEGLESLEDTSDDNPFEGLEDIEDLDTPTEESGLSELDMLEDETADEENLDNLGILEDNSEEEPLQEVEEPLDFGGLEVEEPVETPVVEAEEEISEPVVEETPVEEMPIEEVPEEPVVEETPEEEIPIEEVAEEPIVEEAPIEETIENTTDLFIEDTPVEEAVEELTEPVIEETTVEEAVEEMTEPVVEEAPIEEVSEPTPEETPEESGSDSGDEFEWDMDDSGDGW